MSLEIGVRITPFNLAMRVARREAGLSQRELGELVGASQSKIGAIEREHFNE